MTVTFESPNYLWLLLGLPLLFAWYRRVMAGRKKAAMRFSALGFIKTAMGDKKKVRYIDFLFYLCLLVLALMIIGFADPHIPLEQTQEGMNVVFVMDVSGSMQAKDYKPNRLEASKRSAEILLKSLKPKDNAGIVIFETGATTAAYLSPYKDRVIEKLKNIAPRDGRTAMGDGLTLGVDMATSIPNRKNMVVLLSDGVNNAGVISPAEAMEYARNNGLQVFTIGMGTDEKTVLGHDFFGNPIYAELDEDTLKAIAEHTNGKYFKSVDDRTLDTIYRQISQDIRREKEKTGIKDWFFAGAFLLLLVYLSLRFGAKRVIQ